MRPHETSDNGHAQTRRYQAERKDDRPAFMYSVEGIEQILRGMRFLFGATRRSDLMDKPAWVKLKLRRCGALRRWARGVPVDLGGYREEAEHLLDKIEAGLSGEPLPETEEAEPTPARSVRDAVGQVVRPMPKLPESEESEIAAQMRRGG
ncbi:MAG TPA: hypothetical protein VM537_27125 [Anaerolineae bacterium]|nr:hypothetical protein [Anaerolineae bacterium]